MVDVKDLMVGNFVKDKNGEIMLVGKVHRESVADKWGGIAFDDEIEGIPVTKEILKEIGFEEYEDLPLEGKFYRYWDKDCKYKLDVRDFWTNSQRKWYVHVDNDVCNTIGSGEFDYVHELQNLVRVITGHSLPITKEVFDGLGNGA
jgi:hypothetical protein